MEPRDLLTDQSKVETGHLVEPITPVERITVKDHPIKQKINQLQLFFTAHAKSALGTLLVLVFFGSAFGYVLLQDKHVAVKQFTNVYSFVPEKISKSAPIQINVPEGVTEDIARASITFSPEVVGDWQVEDMPGVITFKPQKPLRPKVYYAVNMDTGVVQMSGDFYVDEDPQVETIFPLSASESNEDTEITIVFNRPMVPLTTLTVQEAVELPIEITPKTAGKFKWISTRNLQFIPDTTLVPASTYTVEIKAGLYSLDGLPLAPLTHTFQTRPLRYTNISTNQIGYRSPIIVAFNQPVDIEATKKNLTVTKENGAKVSVVVEYGEVTYYDTENRKYVTKTDQSKLFIFQKEDSHGRGRLWDFATTYNLAIKGAAPLLGTMNLTEGRNEVVYVPDIVQNVSAQSERSSLVRPDLVDPEGTVTVTFYDDIDKDKSNFAVKGLKSAKYGERCKVNEQGEPIQLGNSCEKEADTKTLILAFDKNAFTVNESFKLELKKIETKDGFRINSEPIEIALKTYPQLQILRTYPEDQTGTAALDEITVCSNAPLQDPGEAGLASYLKTTGYIVYGRWSGSYYVEVQDSYNKCQSGEFETRMAYGLLPETDYQLQLSITDVFGQSAAKDLKFKTSLPKEQYTRFHNLQQQYNVTSPEKTKLTFAVENLEYVDLHLCKMSAEAFLVQTIDRASSFTAASGGDCLEVITKRIELPKRYWVNNYFQVNLAEYFTDTRGHYILTFSNPLYKNTYENRQLYERVYVSVTNLSVGKKEVEFYDEGWSLSSNPSKDKLLNQELGKAKNLYWVNNSKTLQPAVGAVVTQYINENNRYDGDENGAPSQKTVGFTDEQGMAPLQVHKGLVGAVVRSGGDSAVVTDWADTLNYASTIQDSSKTYVYTDRPIYRPGHTVNIRGIDRIGFDGKYEVWNKETVALTIFDSKNAKQYETKLAQNLYGTFATDFVLPSDAPLGTYRIEVFGQSFYFDVEEYVPAAFKLEATTDKEEYINGDIFKLDIQADYYFGVPLDEGTISYSVTAQDYYFDRYTDDYFNFGGDWYYCYNCGYGDDFLFRGETTINQNGHATIERGFNFNDLFEKAEEVDSKLVTVSVTAKDINGRAVSLQKSFIVHKGDLYLGVKTDQYYTGVNSPITGLVKTVDVQGKSKAVSNIEKTLSKVEWETYKRQEVDGGFYYRSEKKLTEISREKIKTNEQGDWSGTFMLAEEGQYELQVVTTDARGNKIKAVTSIYIYGTEAVTVPPNNNYELDLEVTRTDFKVGETASLLIKSPYPKAKALIAVERGTVYDYWVVDVVGGLYVHEFVIKENYTPNVYVSVLLLSPDPEVKYGNTYFNVGTEEKVLSVELVVNKDFYLPGEEVILQVKTKNSVGLGIPAEVSVAVADLSVLALKGNPKKNPLVFFYNGFPLSVTTASNVKNILHEIDIPLGTKGGGGANPDDLAKKKRGIFKDTAFWSAAIETDQKGEATVRFTLPDNLTTWQIEALGVTKDTKLGVAYQEFTTKKDLMAVPLKPRFVVPGDQFSLGAKVFNQTVNDAEINVTLESKTLAFKDKTSEVVNIKAGEAKTVYFAVVAPESLKTGEHTFTFTASDKNFTDSVEQVIPITANNTYETVATANATKDDRAVEYLYVPELVVAGKGGLTINANATLAVFMTDALSYMVNYPYGCSEQLASALSTIGILTEALTLPNVAGELETIEYAGATHTVDSVVEQGLKQIYETQNLSGGFAYYKGLREDLYLTMHVVSALSDLKQAGYVVRDEVLEQAIKYIEVEANRVYVYGNQVDKETVILAEFVLRKVAPTKTTMLTKLVQSYITDQAFLSEKISSMSLAYLAILTAKDYSRSDRSKVYTAFQNRIDIDGRGAYLASNEQANRDFYETSIKNTALAIQVFAAQEDEHETLPNMLRWLLASRDNQGVWGSTHNTFTVVSAMVDYLKWQHETESHFTLRGLLDGVELFGFEFNPQTVFSTLTHFVSIDLLPKEKLIPLVFEKTDKNDQENNLYYDLALKYYLPVESLPPRDEGMTITRDLYALDDEKQSTSLKSVALGEVVKGKLVITVPAEYRNVAVEDYIPAGFELVNFNLSTEDQSLQETEDGYADDYYDEWSATDQGFVANAYTALSNLFNGSSLQTAQVYDSFGTTGYQNNSKKKLRPTHVESHDDRLFLYTERISPGVYEYEYFLRALVPGTYQQLPAKAEELYFPEIFGRTSGDIITVTAD